MKRVLSEPSFTCSLLNTQERNGLVFIPSLFAIVVELQSQNCATSPQRLLQCSRTSQTCAHAAECFSQELQFDFGHVFSTCSIFPPLNYRLPRRRRWQVTQETACSAVSSLTSGFVQDTVIYGSLHQYSSTAEFFN